MLVVLASRYMTARDEVQVKTEHYWRQPLLGAGHLTPALEWRVLLLDLGQFIPPTQLPYALRRLLLLRLLGTLIKAFLGHAPLRYLDILVVLVIPVQ